ncbi:MAG: DUF4340 domain-containing protein [Gammaproteobacteria bacterium]|nr:DUF4340 domain-containing protein [Gammaproteobacteria bacterium]
MASRLWLNLALLLLIGILVLVVVYEPGRDIEPQPTRLTQLTPATVNHVYLKRVTGKDIELVKESDGQWWMHNPYYLPANDFRVQSLLRLTQTESLGGHALKELQLATYGLDKPRAVVTFNRTQQIKFGDTEPLQQRRYVQAGDRLHTIVDTFYYQAAGNPTIYLAHSLLPPAVDVVKLVLPDLQLVIKQGQWQRTPEHPDLSADASIELISHWQHAQALELRPADVRDGKADIEVYIKNQADPVRFKLLQTEDEISLIRLGMGLQYIIADDVYQRLVSLPEPEPAPETEIAKP